MSEEQSTRIMRLIKVHSGVLDGLYDAKYGLENVEKALDKAISIMRNNPDICDEDIKDIYKELKDVKRKIAEIIKVLEHAKDEFDEKCQEELTRLNITFETYVYYLFKDYFPQQQ